MKKFLIILGSTVLILIILLILWCSSNMKDRNKGYNADLKITGTNSGRISAGFASLPVTPEVPDKWYS
jgi:hypothetical protein